jgi:hypothetical protein
MSGPSSEPHRSSRRRVAAVGRVVSPLLVDRLCQSVQPLVDEIAAQELEDAYASPVASDDAVDLSSMTASSGWAQPR